MDLEFYFNADPYGVDRQTRRVKLVETLSELTAHHQESCPPYRQLLQALKLDSASLTTPEQFPFLPVRLFKQFDLRSVPSEAVVKTLTSSGTTSQQVSKIFLDRETSINQTKALSHILKSFIGPKRLPMLILDTSAVIKNRFLFSARGAGILGLSVFGRDHLYVLDEEMQINWEALDAFLERHAGEPILLFGFTFMVWQHFYHELKKSQRKIDLKNGTLIHSGGWKKLQEQAVTNEVFKQSLQELCGIERVYNFYGMVEQTGSIFMECECGHLHASVFSEVIVRDPRDWSVVEDGKPGILEVISVLPGSYPGHLLLTEDLGEVLGEDNCPCGRKGKIFKVNGRLPKAEVRGCSDTYAMGR